MIVECLDNALNRLVGPGLESARSIGALQAESIRRPERKGDLHQLRKQYHKQYEFELPIP